MKHIMEDTPVIEIKKKSPEDACVEELQEVLKKHGFGIAVKSDMTLVPLPKKDD